MSVNGSPTAAENTDDVVVRKAERGWVVGDENVSDLTSAMVLADLFAADQADNDDTTAMEAVDEHSAPRRRPAARRRPRRGQRLGPAAAATRRERRGRHRRPVG